MKILMLTPYLPYPPSSGGQVRSYNLIKQLYKKHDITLFCYIRDESERRFIPELEKYCKEVRAFKRRKAWSPLNILLAGATAYPFLVSIYLLPSFRKAVKKELEGKGYDLIHCETFYVMTNIPKTSLPTILVEQTIEFLVYQHFVNSIKLFFLKLPLALDVAKLKFWEKAFWARADKVVAVSEADKKEMLRLDPKLNVSLVPNGVDLDFFEGKNGQKKEKRILFVSNFKWLQNIEAAEVLIKEVFPRVKSKIPEVKLWIVGQHTPEKIVELAGGGVIIDSLKEDDVESVKNAYNQASVFVSPIKGPGGTRLKNLAAMASKLPIVSTTIGAEGLGFRDGKEALIRDSIEDIADGVVSLIKNPKLARSLARNARDLAEKEYSWKKMGTMLDEVYQETVKK